VFGCSSNVSAIIILFYFSTGTKLLPYSFHPFYITGSWMSLIKNNKERYLNICYRCWLTHSDGNYAFVTSSSRDFVEGKFRLLDFRVLLYHVREAWSLEPWCWYLTVACGWKRYLGQSEILQKKLIQSMHIVFIVIVCW